MRCSGLSRLFVLLALAGTAGVAQAQQAEPTTREGAIAQAQAEKSKTLTPYVPNKGERIALKVENIITGEGRHLHPFFDSAYSGGGFAFGAGYLQHVSPFNYIDVRGSYSLNNYKRAEVEFVAPKLFHRRGHLSVLGGWREATQVKFFGLGNDSPSRRPRELRLPASATVGAPDALADAAISAGSRRLRVGEMVAGTSGRPLSRHRGHPRQRESARCRQHGEIPARAGHGRLRLAHVAWVFTSRGVLRDHRARL